MISENDEPTVPNSRGRKTGLIVTFAFILALLAVLALGLKKVQAGPVSSGPAPDITLTGFDGRTFKRSDLRGQVAIVNFWASWCPLCREEAAYLEQTWRKYEGKEPFVVKDSSESKLKRLVLAPAASSFPAA